MGCRTVQESEGDPLGPYSKDSGTSGQALELPAAVAIEPEMPDEPAREVEAGPKPELLKRVYLRQQDLDRRGYTASCPACDLIGAGISREGVNHTEFCRNRVVTEMGKTEEGKKRLAAAKLYASAQGLGEPEPMEVSASLEPASSSKRAYPGGRDPEGDGHESPSDPPLATWLR